MHVELIGSLVGRGIKC